MQKILPVALALIATALAGCAGDDGPLAIEFEAADDPVTQPFHFKAVGSGDRFLWDFNDGTGTHEGREIEHIFGFTDGKVPVRLTAISGETSETATTTVELGTGTNQIPTLDIRTTSVWLLPGEPLTMSAAGSSDPDGDPVLFRWSCDNLGAPIFAGAHEHASLGGLPFGINALATEDANLTGADRAVEGDLCAGLQDSDFTREGSVSGAFDAVGVYNIDVEVRDPKSPAFVGRVEVFVTDVRPEATGSIPFSGSMTLGDSGTVQEVMDAITNPTGLVWDFDTGSFSLELPTKSAVVTFSSSSPLVGSVEYEIYAGGSIFAPATGEATQVLPAMVGGQTYNVEFLLKQGVTTDYDFVLEYELDMNPHFQYEAPI